MSDKLEISEKEDIMALAKALSSDTRFKITKLLKDQEIDVSTIAIKLGQTEANASAQIKYLEKAKILKCRYEPGAHGVRKVCKTDVKQIVIKIL